MINLKKLITPRLLTGLAIAGVGVTVYFAVKETKAVDKKKEEDPDVVEEETEQVAKEDFPKKLEKAASKCARVAWAYKGTILASGCTTLFIVGSHKLSMKEVAALTATCGYLAANRDKLETEIQKLPGGKEALERVKTELIEKKVQEATETSDKNSIWRYQSVEDTGKGNLLCLEGWSGRLFRSSLDAVEQAQREFNDMRDEDGFEIQNRRGDIESYPAALSMNDLFEKYGVERTQLGHEFGWPADDDYYPTRRIRFVNTLIPLDKLDPVTQARYSEDLLVIEFEPDYVPMQSWQEI